MIDLLNKEKFKKFAEIGVWKSELCSRILTNVPSLEEYWAVDPWDINLAYTRIQRRRVEKQWFLMHWNCCVLMMAFPQLKVLKMTSEESSTVFPDGYLDMVFIDAVHTFEQVWDDIGYWLPKIREGGLISGHDYGGRYPGVKEAVDQWFGKNVELIRNTGIWMKRL